MCPDNDFLETFTKCGVIIGRYQYYIQMQLTFLARNQWKYLYIFLQEKIFIRTFQIGIGQILLRIFLIRLQIRIPRTRFSLKPTVSVIKKLNCLCLFIKFDSFYFLLKILKRYFFARGLLLKKDLFGQGGRGVRWLLQKILF